MKHSLKHKLILPFVKMHWFVKGAYIGIARKKLLAEKGELEQMRADIEALYLENQRINPNHKNTFVLEGKLELITELCKKAAHDLTQPE